VSANIRAVATDISRGRAWIEKVGLATAPDFDIRELAQSDTPQGELLRYLENLSPNKQIYEELDVDLTPLKSKLAGNAVTVPEDDMDNTLRGARDILLAMLADQEGTEKT
jgi:hypothetical protein